MPADPVSAHIRLVKPTPEVVADHVSIRGVPLAFEGLVDRQRLAPLALAELRAQMAAAKPFPHLVIDGLFDPALLQLVHAEFDQLDPAHWRRSIDGELERTHRSRSGVRLGTAAELYFGQVNAGWFVDALSQITGVEHLIADTSLHNGGLHEARRGDLFAIHADFDKHACTRLDNQMVLITYLNQDWDPSYRGALELWDAATGRAVREVEPVFGRSILMRHSAASLHGHPQPMELPPGYARRSVATYYYTNGSRKPLAPQQSTSAFLHPGWGRTLKLAARDFTPPIAWRGLKRLIGR